MHLSHSHISLAHFCSFLLLSGFTAYDYLAEPPCNCRSCSDVSCPACDPRNPSDIECSGMPQGTVYGACLGTDDNIDLAVKVDFVASGDVKDVGMYISLDGGKRGCMIV